MSIDTGESLSLTKLVCEEEATVGRGEELSLATRSDGGGATAGEGSGGMVVVLLLLLGLGDD